MAARPPNLTWRHNGDGSKRYYWRPTPRLRLLGFHLRRLVGDYDAACEQARKLNADCSVRTDEPPAPEVNSIVHHAALAASGLKRHGNPPETSGVYVIGSAFGPVKIGVALDVTERRRTLQYHSPVKLEIWAFVRVIGVNAYVLEQQVHNALSSHRTHGEWFDRTAFEASYELLRQFGGLLRVMGAAYAAPGGAGVARRPQQPKP